jgi:biopolymer transport protein TolR
MKKRKFTSLSEINVTNLVDVIMVLLIIFMITAPLLRSGFEVELPKSSSQDLHPREGILVTLSKDRRISINEEPVKPADFSSRMLRIYGSQSGKQVLLQADKSVQYGEVISLMDQIKDLGINNVGLIVEPVEKK